MSKNIDYDQTSPKFPDFSNGQWNLIIKINCRRKKDFKNTVCIF